MRILINKQNNEKFLKKILQSRIIPLSFLPTSGLFCKDATHIFNICIVFITYLVAYLLTYSNTYP